ncbi:hypothetical protein E2542_SST26685 [Spatholobus suberectus]|nr:hypothetical protein E2542_SST26685 [Spatholobus suberectus]
MRSFGVTVMRWNASVLCELRFVFSRDVEMIELFQTCFVQSRIRFASISTISFDTMEMSRSIRKRNCRTLWYSWKFYFQGLLIRVHFHNRLDQTPRISKQYELDFRDKGKPGLRSKDP